MELSQIQGFVAIAEVGSLSAATKILHITQPALSRRINLLEHELGQALFERLNQGVVLTDAGRAFLPYAELTLAALQDGKAAVADLQHNSGGDLTVALVGSLASSNLVNILSQFRQDFPNIKLQLHTALSQGVGDLVANGDAQVGLRYFEDPRGGLKQKCISQERLLLCCSANHPELDQLVNHQANWADFSWVGFAPDRKSKALSYGQLLLNQLTLHGVELKQLTIIDSLTAQKRLIEAGFGLGLLPESSIQEERALGSLYVVEASPLECEVPIYLISRNQGYQSQASSQLQAYLFAHWQQLTPGRP